MILPYFGGIVINRMNSKTKPVTEEMRNIYRSAKTNMMFIREHLEKHRKTNKLLNWLMKPFDKPKDYLEERLERYDLPIGKMTLIDLIIGPDRWLGPNQIALRELIIYNTINGGAIPDHATFSKEANTKSKDSLAKDILLFFQAFDRGNYKVIKSDIDLKEIF